MIRLLSRSSRPSLRSSGRTYRHVLWAFDPEIGPIRWVTNVNIVSQPLPSSFIESYLAAIASQLPDRFTSRTGSRAAGDYEDVGRMVAEAES
jgi:hypothetical protein